MDEFKIYEVGIIIVVVLINILGYAMKYLLRKNGYNVSLLWGHYRDVAKFKKLIKKQENQLSYKMILYSIYILFIFMVIGVLRLSMDVLG